MFPKDFLLMNATNVTQMENIQIGSTCFCLALFALLQNAPGAIPNSIIATLSVVTNFVPVIAIAALNPRFLSKQDAEEDLSTFNKGIRQPWIQSLLALNLMALGIHVGPEHSIMPYLALGLTNVVGTMTQTWRAHENYDYVSTMEHR